MLNPRSSASSSSLSLSDFCDALALALARWAALTFFAALASRSAFILSYLFKASVQFDRFCKAPSGVSESYCAPTRPDSGRLFVPVETYFERFPRLFVLRIAFPLDEIPTCSQDQEALRQQSLRKGELTMREEAGSCRSSLSPACSPHGFGDWVVARRVDGFDLVDFLLALVAIAARVRVVVVVGVGVVVVVRDGDELRFGRARHRG
jgi:hypothetical protein